MRLLLIQNAEIYTPVHLGKHDILIAGKSILALETTISKEAVLAIDPEAIIIDVQSAFVVPGLIDSHVHFNGAGGEGGPHFRTPPLQLSRFISAGITTAVAPLGTDGISRSLKELLAKARSLENEGISTYMYTGAYGVPSVTITESVMSDIVLIDKIIGTKIALSDHRSSHPTVEELRRIISDARVGGMLSGKAGVVEAHMGGESIGLHIIEQALEGTDIPLGQIIPTHVNRNGKLYTQALNYCNNGGVIDLTTSMGNDGNSVKPSEGIARAMKEQVPISHLTMSTDGNGSMPEFDSSGELVKMGIGEPFSLFRELKDCVCDEKISLEVALKLVTQNVAERLKLLNKGHIAPGVDGDVLVISPTSFRLEYVIAKGEVMMSEGKIVKKGIFEEI
jgi:beta-aspartyl-dipeptidase (metallo-type)